MLNNSNKQCFQLNYSFYDNDHETELYMLINGDNILSFERNGIQLTTRWTMDELALWLRSFINNLKNDPYPIEAEGRYAAIKDINARNFDSDDENEFDEYYDKLDEWNLRHRWHTASNGSILADLYFQMVDDNVEISWNNQEAEEGVEFKYKLGGVSVPKDLFVSEVNKFLLDYANQWY